MKKFKEIIEFINAPSLSKKGESFAQVKLSDIDKIFKDKKLKYDATKVKGKSIYYFKDNEAFASYNKKLKILNIN